jgi:hypothetical protein
VTARPSRRRAVRAGPAVLGGCGVGALAALVLSIAAFVGGPWRAPTAAVEPPGILLVSAVSGHPAADPVGDAAAHPVDDAAAESVDDPAGDGISDPTAADPARPAALDRAVLEEALAALAGQGVRHGPVQARAVLRSDLARVLIGDRRVCRAVCEPAPGGERSCPPRAGAPGARRGRRRHGARSCALRPPRRPHLPRHRSHRSGAGHPPGPRGRCPGSRPPSSCCTRWATPPASCTTGPVTAPRQETVGASWRVERCSRSWTRSRPCPSPISS